MIYYTFSQTCPFESQIVIYGLIEAGFTRIGIHPKFVHADNDPKKVEGVIFLY